jgi:ATP-dependent helicase Lhr and Lhr-like helicase
VTTTGFALLHSALQYHVVNSFSWPALRPAQDAAVAPITGGRDCLILAPTAGGKTEAATIPVMSRMLSEDWRGLSVLYVCPIKALLNNLEPRLARYLGLVGRTVGIWHGDVSDSVKERIRREPPDLLLTTPESLEGLLISRRSDKAVLLGQVRTVIVDELHAFAGDDRGWHLRAVLHRIERYTAVRPQRIGLSATVGNPEDLLRWFSSSPDATLVGDAAPPKGGNLVIDFVESLEGAATVLSRLYRGDKRLVFCDSRSKVEKLASLLREHEVKTFVSHSSLSAGERRAAEAAFTEERDCVIVATSTLELGIDVGDLDHVLQVDAPASVSSLLQRMGRTGRRPGMPRNCTFLTTNDEALVTAAALCHLLADGYTEPIRAPAAPWHLVAQQAMARTLELQDQGRNDLVDGVAEAFPDLPATGVRELVDYLLMQDILTEQGGFVGFGVRGEREFGGRNFLDLVSSFTSAPMLAVHYGATELGFVDPASVAEQLETPTVLSLGGRAWLVQSLDWRRRVVWVEPAAEQGKSRWFGSSRTMSARVAAAVKTVLKTDVSGCTLSKRAKERVRALHERFDFLTVGASDRLKGRAGASELWTFAGGAANAMLALAICASPERKTPRFDDWSIQLLPEHEPALRQLRQVPLPNPGASAIAKQFAGTLKFSMCVPKVLLDECVSARLFDMATARKVAALPIVNHQSAVPEG